MLSLIKLFKPVGMAKTAAYEKTPKKMLMLFVYPLFSRDISSFHPFHRRFGFTGDVHLNLKRISGKPTYFLGPPFQLWRPF